MNFKKNICWCIGLLNRTRLKTSTGEVLRLFENNIRSLLELKHDDEDWCFCIADYESTDVNVKEFLKNLQREYKHVNFRYKISTHSQNTFTRGGARNNAFKLTDSEIVFFLDADMLFTSRDVIDNIYKHTSRKKVYFPICSSYKDITHKTYWKRETGTGNFAILRSMFIESKNTWWEKTGWGQEDGRMFDSFNRQHVAVRDYTETFFHQWHPASN